MDRAHSAAEGNDGESFVAEESCGCISRFATVPPLCRGLYVFSPLIEGLPFFFGFAVAMAETVGKGDAEHAKAVGDAAAEVDGRGFGEVACGAGDFAHMKAVAEGEGEELVVEDEIIAAFVVG